MSTPLLLVYAIVEMCYTSVKAGITYWNYNLIGALLLVSFTIYFARPPPSNTNKYNYDTLDGQIVNSLRT